MAAPAPTPTSGSAVGGLIPVPHFLEAIGVEADPNMVNHPRTSCYVRTDDFSEEADKYFARKKATLPSAAE